jgi:LDH2 family malate/lactate/ureidoglycolate dehydrogenase
MPGEPEQQTRARLLADGIELDETTWGNLLAAARERGVAAPV